MKRLPLFLLLAIFSAACILPAQAQRMTPEQNARQGAKSAKKQQKMLKRAAKQQRKAEKRALKAQNRATKKANRDLQRRRGN